MKRPVMVLMCAAIAFSMMACEDRADTGKAPVEGGKAPAADAAPAPTSLTAETLLEDDSGTEWELMTCVPHKAVPVTMPLDGPWDIRVTPEHSWDVTKMAYESVALADVPEKDTFPDAAYALKETNEAGRSTYHLRSATEQEVVEYGIVAKDGEEWVATTWDAPTTVYPLAMEPGDERPIFEDDNQSIKGVAIAKSTLRTDAGEFENAILVRFDYTHKKENDRLSHHYFLYAPGVGLVAQVTGASGQESGVDVTQANVVQVITSVPAAMR